MPGRDITGEFAALGAVPNAFTGFDMTAYYFSCTDHFDTCLRLLLEFVSTPYFTKESVEKEQGIIAQEIGMYEDSPDSRIFEILMQRMYENHPVQIPILGTRESISQITPEILNLCHKAFYRPDNMLLCVVGDVDPRQVCNIALETLPQKAAVEVARQEHWQESMTCNQAPATAKMEVAMPMFYLGFKCEPAEKGAAAVRQEAIGDLAAEALFGESSGLYLRLYQQGLIDSSFGGGFETVDGMAMLCACGDSQQPEAVRDAILQEAQRITKEGVAQEDFLRMKRSALGRRIRDLDSFDSTCFRICAYHFSGFPYFDFPGIYQSVELEEILEFINRVVVPTRCGMSVIYPAQEVSV
jgi:predicted Zn-dependent peptidase